jgi:two-component system OmpR family sensor kinase
MGRLFWKIFFAFWLVQLAAGIGTGTAVWLRHQAADEREPPRLIDPFLDASLAVLQHGGVAALRDLLVEKQIEPGPPIYAVDESGMEILGREPPPEALAQARLSAESGGADGKLAVAEDGHAYLLFAPAEGPQGERLPPPGPPPSPVLLVIVGTLASLIFSAWLAWYLAKPIRSLRLAFDDLAEGKLDTRIGEAMGKRRDELVDLGRNFDHMAGRVKDLVDAQRRLLHDVSHEFRSPLARLQAAVGLAKQQPDKITGSLERIEREAERLDGLVGEFLTLSRLEAGMPGATEELIDIAGLVSDIVDDARFEAEGKGVLVESDLTAVIFIKGQPELLRRAIENVVRNAIQHAPADSLVTIDGSLVEDRRTFRMRVSDQGPGVPEDQLEAIFTPFFRGTDQPGGVGLGLTIARRAIQAHGGKIGARNRAKGGLCVEWVLPVATTG